MLLLLLSSFIMFLLFMLFMIFSIYLNFFQFSMFFEWLIYINNSINIEFIFLVDWISFLFISILLMISSSILLYSVIYMEMEKFINRFTLLMILFIISMVLMIISPNLISILLGWDGLGVISYCLVIYYQNYSSFNSGMVTILSNRIGDVGLLMSISMVMMNGSWNLFLSMSSKMIIFMIILASLTKSAQIPFSSWLPMAMAAPTPVSALVHSSTLVTAGVYLLIRFNKYLMEINMSKYVMFFAILTMFMSGLMANLEYDLKKIIALSTLSQLGFMMMILSLGFNLLSFYHLLIHAIFKSLLFLCAGIIIHSMSNNQDIRLFGKLNEFFPFTMLSFYISLMSLCGMPFMSGFYSKDLIMEIIYMNKMNMFMLIFSLISLMFTISYSFRLFYYLFFSEIKFFSMILGFENKLMNFSMIMLMLLSIMSGAIMNWLFFYNFNLVFLKINEKFLTLMLCFMGVFFWIKMYFINFIKYYYMSYYLSSMWFLNNFYDLLNNFFLKNSLKLYIFDKTWLEFSKKMFYYNILINLKNYLFYSQFKMYLFMNMILMMLLIFLF